MTAFLSEEVRIVIIYISNDENKEMLNQPAEQYEWELLTEVMDKGSLNSFITDKLQVIDRLQYMVLDRSCITESEQQLSDVIETIHVMWDTKVILLVEELTDDKGEQQRVIYGEKITFLYKYQDNLAGNLEYLLKGEKIPAEEIYDGIWIGVMSANSGAGATHVSIGLTNYINVHGKKVCYVEANESGDLGAMASFYGMDHVEENHYQRDGIDYWHQSIDPEKKFAVLDLGRYSSSKLQLFNQCKIKILITDGKPYRMADALNILHYIGDENTRLWLNFSSQDEYERIRAEYLSNLNHTVGNIGWHKDMFHNKDVLYQEALSEYINVAPGRQKKMSCIVYLNGLKDIWKHSSKESKKNQEELDKQDVILNPDEEPGQEAYSDQEENEVFENEPEQVDNQNTIADDVKSKKRMPVKNNLVLFLIAGILLFTVFSFVPEIKQLASDFPFNNPDTEQTTELVNEDLNINPDIKISVLEVEGADGYEVSYSTDKNFDEKTTVVVEVETADKAVETLTADRTYYVRVRAFKFNEDGTKVYGEYTEVQKIET